MRRPRATPVVLEGQPWECGMAALAIILAHHGCHVPLDELRRVTGISRDGLNGVQLREAGRRYGLELRAVRTDPARLAALGFPCIAHMRFIHFVVVEGMADGRVFLNDQGSGAYDVPLEEFDDDFTGLAFQVRRLPEFVERPRGGSPTRAVARHLSPARWELLGAVAASVGEGTALLALAGILGSWVALPAQVRPRWPWPAILLASIALGAWRLRGDLLRRAGERLKAHHTPRLLRRLSELPTAYFALRLPRFVAARVLAGHEIGDLVRWPAAEVVCQLAAVPVLALGIWSAPAPIPQVTAAGCAVAAGLWWWLYRARRSGWRRQQYIREHGRLGWADRLAAIESCRLGGRDADSIATLAGAQASYLSVSQAFGRREAVAGWARLATPLFGLIVVLAWPSSPLHNDPGGFTKGLVLALGLWAAADAPLRRGAHLATLVTRILQLDEFYTHESDVRAEETVRDTVSQPSSVAVLGVSFGYSTVRPPILFDVNFQAPAGSQVAVAGAPGSGRTTLARVVAGVLVPWTGSVSVPHPCLLVDGHPPVFQGSVRDNVTLWDPSFADADVMRALEDACLDQWVRSRPGGLDSPVELDGTDMSGGERRRLALARALVRAPRTLVLDELLDGLEDDLQVKIRGNLRQRGCTVVVVSCRDEILKECNQVIDLPARAGDRPGHGSSNAAPPPPSPPAVPTSPPRDRLEECSADVLAALAAAAHALARDGSHVPPRLSLPTSTDPLRAAARASGLYLRRVRPLSPSWWREDHGVMVGRSRDGTVALLPRPDGGYRAVDQGGRPGKRLTGEVADQLRAELFAVYRQPLSASWPFARGLAEALMTGRADAAGAFGFLAVAWLLARFLVSRLTEGAGDSSAWYVLGVVPPILACLFAEQRAWLRLHGAAGAALQCTLWARLMRVSVPWLRDGGAAAAAREVETLDQVVRSLVERLAVTLAATAVALSALWSVASMDHHAGVTCGLILAAGSAASLFQQIRSRRIRRAAHDEWLQCQTLLLRWLEHIPSMRVLDARAAVARRWLRQFQRFDTLRTRAAPWSALGVAACPPLVVGAVAAVVGGNDALSSAALARLALFSLVASLALSVALEAQAVGALADPPWHRLEALFAAPLESERDTRYLPRLAGTVNLSNVGFCYPGAARPVLRDLSVRVETGQIVALTGPSGSGKTTLLRLLVGFERPAGGRVEIGGFDLSAVSPDAVRPFVEMVMQDEPLEPATVRWHIAGMSRHELTAVWEAARLAGLDDDLRAMPMGMQTLATEGTFSGSQVCGLQIARALLRRPSILILDEATSGLSTRGHERLFDHLRSAGTAVIIVSHRQDVLALADRVVRLTPGAGLPEPGDCRPEGVAS